MPKFGNTEKKIFYAAVVVLLAFSYFLFDDSLLFPKANNEKLRHIGKVYTSQNDVRRKNLDTFSWLPASHKDQVFQNDSIYTGDRSQAVIQLSGGGTINVQPNSLVTLSLNNGQMNLDLRYGNFVGHLAQGATLNIKSGDEEFELQGGANSKVELKKGHNGVVDLKLLSGNVKYINRKNRGTSQLTPNSAVSVSAKGLKQKEKTIVVLKTPNNISWMRLNPDDPLPFEWTSKGPSRHFELEVSSTPDFNTVTVSKMTANSKFLVVDPLPVGGYHWRVKALDQNGQVVAISKTNIVNIAHLPAPLIIAPLPQAHLEFTSENQTVSTRVSWKAHPTLKAFAWQVSKDQEFTQIVGQNQTPQLTAVTPTLPMGSYWVRVQGQTEDKKISSWSEAVPFTLNITKKNIASLARPILITKKIHFSPEQANRNPASPEKPSFKWQPVLKSKGYHIQISKNPNFKNAKKFDGPATEMAWEQYRPGSYYYRVFAKGDNGAVSPPSEVGTMNIDYSPLTLKPLKPLISSNQGPQNAEVHWTSAPLAKSYIVQIDKSKSFSRPQQFAYQSNSGLITLPDPGQYHVRVRGLDENDHPVTSFSNIEDVLFRQVPPLISPLLLEPFNNASVFLQQVMEPLLWLEWKKVPNATAYRIEISDTPDFSHILVTTTVESNRYLIKERVPMGRIYWRVRAEASNMVKGISDWTEKREFTLYHQKNETFIK